MAGFSRGGNLRAGGLKIGGGRSVPAPRSKIEGGSLATSVRAAAPPSVPIENARDQVWELGHEILVCSLA